MMVYLFGYLNDDFLGRFIVTPAEQTVGGLAEQLIAWSWNPERRAPYRVTSEDGTLLDPALTVAQAGLSNGDIFTVERG
jgi:hypothetical protein